MKEPANPGRFVLPGHKPKTCPCVACRVNRGEAPNNRLMTAGARKRNYLWLSDALDNEVTTLAVRKRVSKGQIVREALMLYIGKNEEG